eukprot:11733813-Heterocapsa_arctica.AAC.1
MLETANRWAPAGSLEWVFLNWIVMVGSSFIMNSAAGAMGAAPFLRAYPGVLPYVAATFFPGGAAA